MCAQRSWDNFKTFNKKLRGNDVFKQTFTSENVMDFLKELNDNPSAYGIDSNYADYVKDLYGSFFSEPTFLVADGVEVKLYSTTLKIYDMDAALGYIFSVCNLPRDATPFDTYLPLLAIYCKFMQLLKPAGNHKPPKTACIVIGAPPATGLERAIVFGASIRGRDTEPVRLKRLEALQDAFQRTIFPQNDLPYPYGNCAEVLPFVCYMNRSKKCFESPLRGMAVDVKNIATKNFSPFAYREKDDHKRTCMNCETLLFLGGQPPYNCFPHTIQTDPTP